MTTPSLPDFLSLGLSPASLKALAQAGFEKPTPIQAQAIPVALAGTDVIGCAATGTGKTAAFALPLIERLAGKPGTRGLILAPTRELALQIAEQLTLFGSTQGLKHTVIIGGVPSHTQRLALSKQPSVIVATPGRLVDHLQQGNVNLSSVEVLVLDEADRMLDMGFKPQLTRILAKVPRARQTMLFSATMAGEVADFAKANLVRPVRIEVAKSGTTAARADQSAYFVSQAEKTALLMSRVAGGGESVPVFTRTKRRADQVCKAISKTLRSVGRIHADRSQAQRREALEGFRAGRIRILVATDIAARGIDVDDIGLVVNFDLPFVAEDYVHRIGRTARAGASGRAISFVSVEERPLFRAIEKLIRQPIRQEVVPTENVAFQAERARFVAEQANPGERRPAGSGASHRPSGRPGGRPGGGGGSSGGGGGGGGGGKPTGRPGQRRFGPPRHRSSGTSS